MRFRVLPYALALLSVLLSACDSSDSKDSNPMNGGAPDITGIDKDFNGIANGSITVQGKVIPIEFIASAYAKSVSLNGFTDLVHQDTGWQVAFGGKTTTTSAQDINEGFNDATVAYRPKLDSVHCLYGSKAGGTVTIESFVVINSDKKTFFRTSGKVSCTLRKSNISNTPVSCPDLPLEVVFTNVDVFDSGLN